MQTRLLPFILIFSLISTCIEVDISVPGFPEIARFFNVSEAMVQLTITYNFLAYCIGAMIYGPLSECFGRRKVMIIGNAILFIGALGCVFAPSINFLLFSRFIQGIGASTSVVLVFAIIADVYQGQQAMKLIGLTNAVLSGTMSIAPIIGGFINQAIGWRGNYASVAIMSLVSWLMLVMMLPETKQKFEKLDFAVIAEDYRKLFFSPKFLSASLVPSLLFAAYMSFIVASSFLYMGTFGLGTMSFVIQQAAIVLSFAVTSLIANRVIQSLGSDKVVKLGIGLSILSILMLTVISYVQPRSPLLTTLFMCIFSVGFAVCYPVIFAESLNVFPALRGTAASAIMGLRALLVSVFTGLTGYLYNGEPVMVSACILLGVFLAFLFTVGMVASGRFLPQTANAS